MKKPVELIRVLCALLVLLHLDCSFRDYEYDGGYEDDYGGETGWPASRIDRCSGESITSSGCSTADLEHCIKNTPEQTANSNLVIVDDIGNSYHEMVACGGLQSSLSYAVNDLLYTVMQGKGARLPDGYTYKGNGIYRAGNADFGSTYMTVEFSLHRDFEGSGMAGDRITVNLLDFSNYLKGVSVAEKSVSFDFPEYTTVYEVSFDSTGPLVELLGLGPDPQSPVQLAVTVDYITGVMTLPGELDELLMNAVYYISDSQDQTAIAYEVEVKQTSISSFMRGQKVDFAIRSLSAVRDEQSVTVDRWSVQYTDSQWGSGALLGCAEVRVTGGEFNYRTGYSFDRATYADISCSCE